MTTRAVLLTSSGAVHRVIVGSDGADRTACGQTIRRHVQVSPLQALVYRLPECHGGECWRPGAWEHFKEGTSP